MKLIDRLAYISYWITIFFLLFSLSLPVIFIKWPDSRSIFFDKGMNSFKLFYSILNLIAFFHWIYCIRFLFKFDRYSKSIFPLVFFNVFYAPRYYYRVIIMKRPLRNKINKLEKPITEDYSISDSEFIELTRDNIIRVLNLWASKTEQLELRKAISSNQVSSELFDYWCDYSMADSEVINETFHTEEIELLAGFDKKISNVENKFNRKFPDIEEFQETPEWYSLNQSAKEILKKI